MFLAVRSLVHLDLVKMVGPILAMIDGEDKVGLGEGGGDQDAVRLSVVVAKQNSHTANSIFRILQCKTTQVDLIQLFILLHEIYQSSGFLDQLLLFLAPPGSYQAPLLSSIIISWSVPVSQENLLLWKPYSISVAPFMLFPL